MTVLSYEITGRVRVWRQEPTEEWRIATPEEKDGRRCRATRCAGGPVAALYRSRRDGGGSWWLYCEEHLFGRQVVGGKVMGQRYEPMPPAGTLDRLAVEGPEFSCRTFPSATPESISAHLLREAAELVAAPLDPAEMADVALLLFHLASKVGVDLRAAIAAKLAINRARAWGEPNPEGFVEHVRTNSEDPQP